MRSTYRTLLLWLVLLGLFFGVFAWKSDASAADVLLALVRYGVAGGGALLALGVFLAGLMRHEEAFVRRRRRAQVRRATALLDAGRREEALAFWQWRERLAAIPHGKAYARLQRARLLQQAGRLHAARDVLEELVQRRDVADGDRELARALVALGEALEGQVARAQAQLEAVTSPSVRQGVLGGLAEQVLLLRQGRAREALMRAVPPWDVADPAFRFERRAWALLRAHALSQLEPTADRRRDAERCAEELARASAGELDVLAAGWPELHGTLLRLTSSARLHPIGQERESVHAVLRGEELHGPSAGLGLPLRYDAAHASASWLGCALALGLAVVLGMLVFSPPPWRAEQLALLGGVVLVCTLRVGRLARMRRRLTRDNDVALFLLNEGDVAGATRVFESLRDAETDAPMLRTRASYSNLAVGLRRSGQRPLARRIFHVLAHGPAKTPYQRVEVALAWELLAECEALDGQMERAGWAVAQAAERWGEHRPYPVSRAELLVALRTGALAEAVSLSETLLALQEVPAHDRLVVELCRAFARWQQGTGSSEASATAAHSGLRRRLQAAAPGELDYLLEAWPELGAFTTHCGYARAA